MNAIYHKIWRDLWHNKARTLQVVLIIAMGAFAIGMIITARNLSREAITSAWRQATPPMMMLWVTPTVDDDDLTALKRIEGVSTVDGMLTETIEWRRAPGDEWQSASLIARDDYDDQKLNVIHLLSGNWPHRNTFAVGKDSDTYFSIFEGDSLTIKINDKEREITVGGTMFNQLAEPLAVGGDLALYTTRQRFEALTGEGDFNVIMASSPLYDETSVRETADRINRHLEKQDVESGGVGPQGRRTLDPGEHFLQNLLDGVFLILGLLGLSSIIMGLFLNYNTINAIITGQVDQIGVMKAIGARTGQILWIYLFTIFVYGLLALIIAVPFGAVGGYGMAIFMIGLFGIDPIPFTIDPLALQVQAGIALLSPLLAALFPITAGVRITVREAITTYGLGTAVSLLDRLAAKMERIPRPVLLTVSNTFRNKRRVLLTQLTLVTSGLVFMVVMSARYSATYTFSDEASAIHKYNVTLQFEDPERIQRVERLTLAQPGVKAVEMWSVNGGKIRPTGQAEMSEDDHDADIFGMPIPTTMYVPHLQAGRWLQPEDEQAIVLNQRLAEKTGVGVGDWVTIDHGLDRESDWLVVGLVSDPLTIRSAYVPRYSLGREIGSVNKANTVWVQTTRPDAGSTAQVARQLRNLYDYHDLTLAPRFIFRKDTLAGITAKIREDYDITVILLAIMAAIVAVVGSIGLSGVLSLSVLERRREIGVMRAIGASSGHVARLFIGEGLTLGLLSWLIALPLSIPAAYTFTQLLASALDTNIVAQYAPIGAILWLAIITTLSIIASWFPARGATRISVRESLSYQ
jgi:putative ABC transport system permease protein